MERKTASQPIIPFKTSQLSLTVDGAQVKLNFAPKADTTTKVDTLKKMILSGIARV